MFDLFKIGFLTVSFLDVIDIFVVSLIIYKLYTVIRGTIAAQIFIGLIIVLVLSFIAQAADLKALGWLLKLITDIWVIAFIVLFQPEIRRLLVMLGRSPFARIFIRADENSVADILTDSVFEMAQNQHGALIVVIKFYKLAVSPLLPSSCRFSPTCSEYAITALQRHGMVKGLLLSIKRILRCNPFCEGGYDPVP